MTIAQPLWLGSLCAFSIPHLRQVLTVYKYVQITICTYIRLWVLPYSLTQIRINKAGHIGLFLKCLLAQLPVDVSVHIEGPLLRLPLGNIRSLLEGALH